MSGEYSALAEAERLHTQARAAVERGHKLIAEGHRALAESLKAQRLQVFVGQEMPEQARAHTLIAEGHEALAEAAVLDQRAGELRSKTLASVAPTMDKAAEGIEKASAALEPPPAPRSPSRPPPHGLS